ncbi:MAG TPA: YciI family protein [Bryobacteraceae bacterium]|nr:YciI family protein [Bryobacteraceae bacterium]
MPQYMLLLYDNPANWQNLSPEEMQKALEKYMAWTQKPYTKDSKRLGQDAGRVIRRPKGGQARATDGPYSETKEVLGGYYTIEAANYDEAVKLAIEHPHLDYGGTVEVRQVWGT